MAGPALVVRDLSVAYGQKLVLWDAGVSPPPGALTGIVGPNGAGKSTLLKAVLGLVPAAAGEVTVDGRRPRPREIAYVPQRKAVDWEFPVDALDVVLMGLYGEMGWGRRPGPVHRRRSLEALDRVGMARFAKRQISQLSGGQQQRVFLARALVQDAPVTLMDEPFAGVDAATEGAIVELLHALRDEGRTVVAVHHDLQTVRRTFDHLLLLNMRVVAEGPTDTVFTEENLRKTYGGRSALLDAAVAALGRE